MTNLNDLQQIREFVQIAESGSISAAAKILGMGQCSWLYKSVSGLVCLP
jgi:DNA-binding transcriptional LysR family regulator